MPEATPPRRGLQVVEPVGSGPLTSEPPLERVPAASAPEGAAPVGQHAKDDSGDATRTPVAGSGASNGVSGQRRTAASPRTAAPPAAPEPRRTAGSPAGGEARGGAATDATAGRFTGSSLTTDELCAASGLSVEEVAGLEGFGLIEPVMVAGIPTYDEDALTVANLAASFAAFGIEPRHLRLYRNAADREIGLIEQVVIPLLRQRNPEARQRALEGAEQLAALGQSMRATLLRLALRRHLGG
jgi:hypothetical protein